MVCFNELKRGGICRAGYDPLFSLYASCYVLPRYLLCYWLTKREKGYLCGFPLSIAAAVPPGGLAPPFPATAFYVVILLKISGVD